MHGLLIVLSADLDKQASSLKHADAVRSYDAMPLILWVSHREKGNTISIPISIPNSISSHIAMRERAGTISSLMAYQAHREMYSSIVSPMAHSALMRDTEDGHKECSMITTAISI